MERIVTDFRKDQIEKMKRITAQQGISRAEYLRRLVDGDTSSEEDRLKHRKAVLEAVKGSWNGEDGVEYQRRVRQEWEDRFLELWGGDV